VGPKLAQRIVNELKDKAGGVALGSGGAGAPAAGGAAQDAVSAMLNLGFKPAEASAAVNAAADELGAGATLDALVRLALRKAAK
jgi:holliday junction DNA helicase RuvA